MLLRRLGLCVMKFESRESRRESLERVPVGIREGVEVECKRLWNNRRPQKV